MAKNNKKFEESMRVKRYILIALLILLGGLVYVLRQLSIQESASINVVRLGEPDYSNVSESGFVATEAELQRLEVEADNWGKDIEDGLKVE